MQDTVVPKLYEMLNLAKSLAALREPALEGDIQIVLAILSDKLSYMDPLNYVARVTEYE